MADVTSLFKAIVKTIKSREKIVKLVTNGNTQDNLYNQIFPTTKNKGDFEKKAKDLVQNVTTLRDFLLKHRKDYINAGSHIMGDVSQMTDVERDQVDNNAQDTIKMCKETINTFKNDAMLLRVHPQVKDHRNAVIKLIGEYLKSVCKIYSEQRAVRVKRVVDRKRISKLEPERKYRKKNPESNAVSSQSESRNVERAQSQNQSAIIADEKPRYENDSDSDISPEDAQMFARENEALYDEMNSLAREVGQIEGRVVEIARLQEIFTEKVLEQEKDIDRIADQVVGTTENVKEGNEEIREAMKNSAGFRVWILFFILVLSLSILFLDWYNT